MKKKKRREKQIESIYVDFNINELINRSIPNLEEAVPWASGDGHAVLGHAQAAHTIIMASEYAGSLQSKRVPYVAIEVVVAGEQQAATLWECHGRDAANDVVMWVHADLLVGAYVEQAARGVVRARCEHVAVREELETQTHRHTQARTFDETCCVE